MAKILIGWESGGGFGHAVLMRMAARELKARGHEPVLAMKDVIEPAPMLKDEDYPVIQGPYYNRPTPPHFRPFTAATFADILAVTGFWNVDELAALLRAWDSLFDVVRPDVVLAEYAPIMVLAARGRYPTVMYGTGFTMPPTDVEQYPRLQPKTKITMPEADVLAVVQEAQRRRGAPVPKRLPEIFECDHRFPCCFPELDPYRDVRREPVTPPLGELPPPSAPPKEAGFFAYLAADAKRLGRALSGFIKSGVPGGVFLRAPPPALKAQLKQTKLTLYEEPVPLEQAFAKARVVVHHGGAGTAEACLTAGRPQMIFPRHLEQTLTARALQSLGAGLYVPRDATDEMIAKALRKMATDDEMSARAAALSKDIAARGPRPGVTPIVDACESLLAGGRAAGAASRK